MAKEFYIFSFAHRHQNVIGTNHFVGKPVSVILKQFFLHLFDDLRATLVPPTTSAL